MENFIKESIVDLLQTMKKSVKKSGKFNREKNENRRLIPKIKKIFY